MRWSARKGISKTKKQCNVQQTVVGLAHLHFSEGVKGTRDTLCLFLIVLWLLSLNCHQLFIYLIWLYLVVFCCISVFPIRHREGIVWMLWINAWIFSLRRKDYIEQMRRYEHDRRGDERFQEMVRKAREEHDMAAAERNTSKAVTAIKINELVEQTPPKNL